LLENFPEQYKPREIQIELINKIKDELSTGVKNIVLCAPTGVGKSLIAATLSKSFKNSFIVTSSKQLQDQYMRDFDFLKPVKGKRNFECLSLIEQYDDHSMTCQDGQCRIIENGKEVDCKYKPKISQVANNTHDEQSCHYYLQKYVALTSAHSIWNYSMFFQVMKNKLVFKDYINREIAIYDEAHKIEDQIIQFIGLSIHIKEINYCKLNYNNYDFTDIDSMIKLTDDMSREYSRLLNEFRTTELERQFDKFKEANIQIRENRENFVINDINKGFFDDFKSVDIKPIDISKYCRYFFQSDVRVFMSATLDKKGFCENIGIYDIAFIDVEKSPFPIENRTIKLLNIAELTFKTPEQEELKVIRKINELLDYHNNERGLILTSSINRCKMIIENVSAKNAKRIKMCHASDIKKILPIHEEDSTSVLISSSLWEGIDLKNDLSRFQIIAKIPYPNFTEKRTQAKMKQFKFWYLSQTRTKLLQGFGRSIRSESDYAITYVLDSKINDLFKIIGVPQVYKDVLIDI